MRKYIGFRLDETLHAEIERHRNEVKEQTGYKPDISEVVRTALRKKLEARDEDAAETEGGAC